MNKRVSINIVSANDLNTKEEPHIIFTPIEGLLIIKRPQYPDSRGSFQELYRIPDIISSYKNTSVLQAQISVSKNNVLRGIHVEPRDKIITPIRGRMSAVVVDLRLKSKTFKKWMRFDFDNTTVTNAFVTLFVPEGCGNSLCAYKTENDSHSELIYHYTYSSVYDPRWAGMGVRYDDKELDISWPIENPEISDRDKALPTLEEFVKIYR